MGTVDYVAPEQIKGEVVDGRTDEYSLACVVYQCLTQDVPFEKDTDIATMFSHLQDPPPSLGDPPPRPASGPRGRGLPGDGRRSATTGSPPARP